MKVSELPYKRVTIEEAGFTPPFVPGALKTLAGEVEKLLEEIRV